MPDTPNVESLGRWIHSWIQKNGAIHGFHNHSVWGNNPYRYGDMTATHSTFASPLIPALGLALKDHPDEGGFDLINQLIEFQCSSFQEDGQYRHVGFQVGEMLNHGLIHNMVPDASLGMAAHLLKDSLDPGLLEKMNQAIRRNFDACDVCYGPRPANGLEGGKSSVCNQEYCRLWARLLHMEAFQHSEWDTLVREGLHFMIDYFHVANIPDTASSGARRMAHESRFVEPAEYYGLMIAPLVLGYQRYGEERFLREAIQLANHLVHGSWVDDSGNRRLHRMYQQQDNRWIRVKSPMLIGGMGISLFSIQQLQEFAPREEYASFLTDMDRTYAHYQAPSGFFLAASGWQKEADIIPSTAWESHDLLHLIHRHGVPESFWNTIRQPQEGVSAVLGENCIWLEDHNRWALRGYFTMHDAEIIGRKDREVFIYDIPDWIAEPSASAREYRMKDEPVFQKIENAILYFSGRKDIHILNATDLDYRGPSL